MTDVIEKTEYKKGYKKTKLGWIPEDWKMVKIKNLTCVKSGSTPLRANYNKYFKDGTIKWVKTLDLNNGVLQDTQEKITDIAIRESSCSIFPKNTVLVAMYGGFNQIGRTGLMNFDGCINQALSAILPNDKFNPVFMLNWLNYNVLEWRNYAASSRKDPNITKNDVEKFIVILPSKQEQKKIAEILSAWDEGIETLEKLIEQKEIFHKALMKNLLIGKIRLFGFSKISEYKRTKLGLIPVDWQVKPLKLLFDKRMQKYSGNTEYNIFTNSATKGIVLQNEYFDRSIVTEENTSNYYVVREDDFMYNPRISQSAPAGPINRNKLGITGIASPLYTIFKAKHDTIVDFYEQYFSSNLWNNSMFIVANQGARHDRLNITSNDFMNMPLPYPPIKEQEKIANILIESYKEIQILNSKLEKLKDQKKGLMQKLLTGQIRVKV